MNEEELIFTKLQLELSAMIQERNNVWDVERSRNWYSRGPTKLTHHLYLGDYGDADSLGQLEELGITHVLNCAGESLASHRRPLFMQFGKTSIVGYREYDAVDDETYDMSQHFQDAIKFISDASESDGKTLVYCRKGMNRSVAVCVAYLMWEQKTSLWDTVNYVAKLRGKILTNTAFQAQLIRFAQEMFGLNSDK